MATLTLTLPNAHHDRVIDALCADGGWSAAAGVDRATFAKDQVASLVTQRVLEVERCMAREAALAAVESPDPVKIT